MSEFLDAAAQVVGAPAELVLRSAEARAQADGVSVDEVLAAWAGDSPMPSAPSATASPAPATPAVSESPPPPAAPSAPPELSEDLSPAVPATPVVAAPAVAPTVPTVAATGPPPVLTGRQDRPFRYFFGAAVLLALCLLVTVVLPPLADTGRGAFHSQIPYSDAALGGQTEYLTEGCAGCHTQLVRPIVADAQLAAMAGEGGVSRSDTNQVIGRQRYGPDLANVGNRMDSAQIEAVLTGEGGHVLYRGDRMDSLVAYLAESKVSLEGTVGE